MTNPLGATRNARTPEQVEHMRNTVERGICPFCNLNPELNQLIGEGEHWRLWPNPFPYKHHRHHFVLATKRHMIHPRELSREAWSELQVLFLWTITEYDLPGGGFVMRFGDLMYNAGTLQHLHAHIQVPDLTGRAVATFAKEVDRI